MPIVLGIDAAWTPHNPSGVALLEVRDSWRCLAVAPSYESYLQLCSGTSVDWHARAGGTVPNARDLVTASERLAGAPVDVVCVDMPIATRPITGRREADSLISREFGSRWCAAHSPTSTRPGELGAQLTSEFAALGYPVATAATEPGTLHSLVEVYPHPALLTLLKRDKRVPYKVSKAKSYWPSSSAEGRRTLILAELRFIALRLEEVMGELPMPFDALSIPSPSAMLKRLEDAIDAIVSAWVGGLYVERRAIPHGDDSAAVWCPDPVAGLTIG